MEPTTESIVQWLRQCASDNGCKGCPYHEPEIPNCFDLLKAAAADRLEVFERAMSRLGQFGKLFLDYDGCPRGARGRMGNATLIDEALSMEPITDVDGNKWIPVQEEVLRELCEAVQQRWIPVTERLPEGSCAAWLFDRGSRGERSVHLAFFVEKTGWMPPITSEKDAYWLHILEPEPPKEDEGE